MRRIFATLVACLILTSLVLCGCSAATQPAALPEQGAPIDQPASAVQQPGGLKPAAEIVIYHWTEYIDPEIYTLFEQEYGIRLVEDNFSSNEEMLAKLQGGANGYALIIPSDYTVRIMIEEDLLAELNQQNIPNLANLAERFRNLDFDPGNKYCAPYQWGSTGIGYLEEEVEEPTSWSVLFNPDANSPTYGRATMLDDVRESFAAALVSLGYDINTTDEAQLQQAKQLLIQAKAGLSGYDSDTFENLLASGENLLAHGWNGDFLVAQEDNENIAYTVPEEGGVIWVDNICIPATASPEQKLAGEMFINFLLRPEIGAMLSEYNSYASPNAAAEALLDEEFLNDPAVYPPQNVLDKLQFIRPVGEAESLYQRLWDEVKSSQ